MDDKDKLNIVYDNYKEAFKLSKEAQADRNKFFLITVILMALLLLMTIYPIETIATFQSFIKNKINVEVKFNFFVVQSIIWFLLFYYNMQYYQKNISIERQYGYLSDIEEALSTEIHRTLNREGKNYLKNYPLYSDFIDWIYKWVFPLISIILIVIKIVNEWLSQRYSLRLVFDLSIAILIIVSTILYILFLHQESRLSIWANKVYQNFKKVKIKNNKKKEFAMKFKKYINEIRGFYCEHSFICVITIIAFCIIILYQATTTLPQLWNNADKQFEVLYQLSLAIIANFIFFVFQVYIPNVKKKKKIQPYIKKRLIKISEHMNEQFEALSQTYLSKKIKINQIEDSELEVIIKNFRARDESNIQVAFECRQLNNLEMITYHLDHIDDIIIELQNIYQDYLHNGCDILLKEIINCNYRDFFKRSVPLLLLFDTSGISGDAILPTFKDYKSLYQRLLDLIN